MTLKNYANELSQNAKAFSVESLLSGKTAEDGILKRKLNKSFTTNSTLRVASGITAELFCHDLWEKFNRLGTEMIVTRAGRRMFPTLKVRFHGLSHTANYIVYMDVTLAGATRFRYNFQRSEWTPAGLPNNLTSNNVYVHPSSPAKGEVWMSLENISFDKVKLTNNRKPSMQDQVSLHSMHKYQPGIHVLEVPHNYKGENIMDYIRRHSDKSESFIFEQTAFIAVTAYQNQEITNLKIQSNPFAKGFREMLRTKGKNRARFSSGRHLRLACPTDQNLSKSYPKLLKNPSKTENKKNDDFYAL